MAIITPTLTFTPPPALEVVYYGSLPGYDKKQNSLQLGFPISYYSKDPLSPEQNVYIPSSTVESANQDYISTSEFTFTSGYSTSGSVTNVIFSSPVSGAIYVKDTPYNYTKTSIPIKISEIDSDGSHTWYPVITNGVVYKDIIVTQEELDYSVGVTGSTSWLKTAGFVAGDILRCFYTISQESFKSVVSSQNISVSGNRVRSQVVSSEAVHSSDGLIHFSDTTIEEVSSLAEISSSGIQTIFSGASISAPFQGPAYQVTQVNFDSGELTLIPNPDPGALLSTSYIKTYTGYEYRGFYNEKSNIWQALDLNPTEGRLYNSGIDTGTRTPKSTTDLLNKSVYIYMLPTACIQLNSSGNFTYPIKYYSAYTDGAKPYTWYPIRHYVPESNTGTNSISTTFLQAASWGYAIYDQDFYASEVLDTSRDRGIPLFQNSALLLGVLRCHIPVSDVVEDSRRFSGLAGFYDRHKTASVASKSYWDVETNDTLSTSVAGAVLVEVEQSVLDAFEMSYIEKTVEKHLSPGIKYVIRKKE